MITRSTAVIVGFELNGLGMTLRRGDLGALGASVIAGFRTMGATVVEALLGRAFKEWLKRTLRLR